MIFVVLERINKDHLFSSTKKRKDPIINEEIINLNAKIIRWDLIPMPVPLTTRLQAIIIPPIPIREMIIFITMIIFLIYTLITHTTLQIHQVTNR